MKYNSQDNNQYSQPKTGQKLTITQNGVIISGKNTKESTVKNRCFKCGKLKSQHTGLFGMTCPK